MEFLATHAIHADSLSHRTVAHRHVRALAGIPYVVAGLLASRTSPGGSVSRIDWRITLDSRARATNCG